MRIGVIIGSIRRGRKGADIGTWVAHIANAIPDAADAHASFDVIDINDFNLSLLVDEQLPALANKQYSDPATQAWSQAVDQYDGFIFVTPEYNHSVPGAMKNAFDMLFGEWAHKPVGFVGYGAAGGIRAVEHWRAIVANLYMMDARQQVSIFLETDFIDNTFSPAPQRQTDLEALITEVLSLSQLSKTLQTTT